MRRLLFVVSALALFTLAGCDCAGPTIPEPGDDTGGRDGGGMDSGRDASGPDASLLPDAGPPSCLTDLDCPPGLLCFGTVCQADPCATDSPCMGEDERCRAVCVALVDPCDGVTCGADETCVNGECFPGCLPIACEGVSCPDGQFCNPSTGGCADIVACDATCGDEHACHFTCTPRSACEGVTCEEGQFCRAGACIDNPCFEVDCAPGEVCANGLCVETCGCDPACDLPARCIGGECVCIPRCAHDAECGAADGCGGFCVGECPGPQDECNPDTGLCECIPECPADAMCGRSDGCGGRCMGPCPAGRSCIAGACECTDACVEGSMIDCGVEIPETCMGSVTCPGEGTRCAAGSECLTGSCCPGCAGAGMVACGDDIPDVIDASGAPCRMCSGVGSQCASGTTCLNPPGTTAPDARVCCAACGDPSTVPCGTRVPDVRDASGAICRTCTGYGTSGCAVPGSTCTGGVGGMCCMTCPAATAVDCGEPIPSPTCRTCTGFGSRCTAPETCRNPPGTTSADDRVCCGACASASTVACGATVPDVRSASGAVCRTCGAGTMCASGSDCIGTSCCPRCPAPSTATCGMAIPDRRDASGAVCRTCSPGTMCAAGTTCTGGSCCPTCAAASSLACGVDPVEPPGCAACPNGTTCPAGARCGASGCCAPTCTLPSTRPCGSTPSDGCGGTCAPGTMCTAPGEECGGSPLSCACTPSCVGRRCGESNGCGGECIGSCDPGFVCSERPAPVPPGDYQCEPSECVPTCGLCQSCILGECEPLTCAPGDTPCLFGCECCPPGEICTSTGCDFFG